MSNPIEFPGLGLGPFDPGPTVFTIAGRDIQWYGLLIATAFLLAAIYGIRRAVYVGIKGDDITDALFFCVPAGIIGARIYYVVFNWQMFSDRPLSMFAIWEGGAAFYGSLIGALLAAWGVAKFKKISVLALLDIGVIGFFIGQSIGRWGNYINREAFGAETDLPWRMEIFSWEAYARVQVHPTFLYESLWTALGFVLLHILLKRRKYDGQLVLVYLVWYGFGRGLIEGLRTDSLYLFNTGLRVSQVLAFISCAAGAALLIYFKVKPPKKPLYKDISQQTPEDTGSGTAGEHEEDDVPEEQRQSDPDGSKYRYMGKDE